MHHREDDLGQFNDSTVFLKPISFNNKAVPTLSRHTQPSQGSLGIYNSIKLTPLIENKAGELLEFITLDAHSHNTFVTKQAYSLLERYSADEICFVVVVGNQESGKSFFCDKILNLSQIKGNHFCRKKNKGINIWSTPFIKQDLKIFILEINHCDILSPQFKVLSTYALMIGSVFVTFDSMRNKGKSPIQQLDEVICNIAEKLTPSRIGRQNQNNAQLYMPKIYYNISRHEQKASIENLKIISFYSQEVLPDARKHSYNGNNQDLIHLPFLDTKCINEDYIRKTASIFKDIYSKLSEKKYKELVLNGNIVAKVIKEIQGYLNIRTELYMEELYIKVIQDLYQSAYNYCILQYHEEMQRQFEDQKPKSFEELLRIFQEVSEQTLEKFSQFNLDQTFYNQYFQRLEDHISEKEKMIMDINSKKTQQIIFQQFDENQIGNIKYYRHFIDRLNSQYKDLTHDRAQIVGKINSRFYQKSNNSNSIQYQTMREIEKLKGLINNNKIEYENISKINQRISIQRSKANKEQEAFLTAEHTLKNKIKQLTRQITKVKNSSSTDPTKQKEEEKALTQQINNNNRIIQDYKQSQKKDQRVSNIEKKIEEVVAKCNIQEKLLKQLRESSKEVTQSAVKDKRQKKGSKKDIK